MTIKGVTIKASDRPLLRRALRPLALSAILSCALVTGAGWFQLQARADYESRSERLRSSRDRYLAVAEEKALIRRYLAAFKELRRAGVLGEERRLDWLEALQTAGEEIGIPSLLYDIASRQEHPPPPSLAAGGYRLFASAMSLQMRLLHEGDLFRLLRRLDEAGVYTVSACELERDEAAPRDSAAGRISARCELLWYSLQPADDKEREA